MQEIIEKLKKLKRQYASCPECGAVIFTAKFCIEEEIVCKQCKNKIEVTITEGGVHTVTIQKARDSPAVPTKLAANR